MKTLWHFTDRLHVGFYAKNRIFLFLTVVLSMLAGGLVWLAVGRLILPGLEELLVFMACPGILLGFFGGIIYLYNHGFSRALRQAYGVKQPEARETADTGKIPVHSWN